MESILDLPEPCLATVLSNEQCRLRHSLINPHVTQHVADRSCGLKLLNPLTGVVICQLEFAPLDENVMITGIELEFDDGVTARKRNNATRLDFMDRQRQGRTDKRFESSSRILFRKIQRRDDTLNCECQECHNCSGKKENNETALVLHVFCYSLIERPFGYGVAAERPTGWEWILAG